MSNQSYPSWTVGLWISNDEVLSYHKDVLVQQSGSVDELADSLKDWITEEDYPLATHTNMYTDLLGWALQQVDWRELAESYWEDKEAEEDSDICDYQNCIDPQMGYECAVCGNLTCVSCDTYYYVVNQETGEFLSDPDLILKITDLDGNVAHLDCVNADLCVDDTYEVAQ